MTSSLPPIEPSVTVTPCGATYPGWDMACDKEAGHLGQHRAYVEAHDIVVFWNHTMIREGINVKNEHIIWAFGDKEDGTGQVVILGLTDEGIDYLRAGNGTDKKTLLVNPPSKGFANVTQIVLFHEKDKATLKERLRESGLVVSEVN